MAITRCLKFNKRGLQCKCRVSTGIKWCFQHKEQITFLDLFSGGGGFSQGFIKAGLKPLLCLDRDIFACNTLKKKKNHPNVPVVHSSVETYDFSSFKNRVNILLAGAPCQSFSFAGLKKGLDDHNGSALLTSIGIIFLVQPKIFIIENVKGLLTPAGGVIFKDIMGLLLKDNLYSVQHELIKMVDYGIPQKRERVLIVGA
jgi:DNA (cytosine-5)-methyltransferase 1